jgi:polysaccharide export outer membrane protein
MQRIIFGMLVLSQFVLWVSSCTPVTKIQYMQGSFDTAQLSRLNYPEPRIQKGDLLGVSVFSDDPVATSLVVGTSAAPIQSTNNPLMATTTPNGGYFTSLVDDQGDIQVYRLGQFKVEGMTRRQVAELLKEQYLQKQLLIHPLTEVKLLNYKITLVGEVGHPGPISVPADHISIMEAVGLAGDITVYGRRDNVLVVRETDGKRVFGRLNLGDPNAYLSPFFYLRQNDLVVVDVDKSKTSQTNQTTFQIVAVSASVLSTIAIFINVLK